MLEEKTILNLEVLKQSLAQISSLHLYQEYAFLSCQTLETGNAEISVREIPCLKRLNDEIIHRLSCISKFFCEIQTSFETRLTTPMLVFCFQEVSSTNSTKCLEPPESPLAFNISQDMYK